MPARLPKTRESFGKILGFRPMGTGFNSPTSHQRSNGVTVLHTSLPKRLREFDSSLLHREVGANGSISGLGPDDRGSNPLPLTIGLAVSKN